MKNNKMNAFEALCEQASNEKWCWMYPCSTCANMEFRYGFLELAKGKHPSDTDWILNRHDIVCGKIYKFPYRNIFEYPIEIRDKVLKICLESNLKIINDRCDFPQWLGYIGLVLQYMNSWREPSKLYKEVSVHWEKQLQDMIPRTSDLYGRTNFGLDFHTLEFYEKALNGEELASQIKTKKDNLLSKMKTLKENLVYQCLLGIIEDRDDYSYVRIDMYGGQSDINLLSVEEKSILWEKLKKYDRETPFGRFREKYINDIL